jgi:hypothetical protein
MTKRPFYHPLELLQNKFIFRSLCVLFLALTAIEAQRGHNAWTSVTVTPDDGYVSRIKAALQAQFWFSVFAIVANAAFMFMMFLELFQVDSTTLRCCRLGVRRSFVELISDTAFGAAITGCSVYLISKNRCSELRANGNGTWNVFVDNYCQPYELAVALGMTAVVFFCWIISKFILLF